MDPISIGVMAGVGTIGSLAGGVIGAGARNIRLGRKPTCLTTKPR